VLDGLVLPGSDAGRGGILSQKNKGEISGTLKSGFYIVKNYPGEIKECHKISLTRGM
jgi:hypothetical protein